MISLLLRFRSYLVVIAVSLLIGSVGGYKLCEGLHSIAQQRVDKKANKAAEGHIKEVDKIRKDTKEKVRTVIKFVERTGDRECLTPEQVEKFNGL